MQFHLNGFRPGDPAVYEAVGADGDDSSPDTVDVLIVGSGPAGLTLAAQLAAFPDITTRIVEVKPGPLRLGQADGIACRSMEMFEAFGFSERVMKEGYWVNETTFWTPDPEQPGNIVRSGRVQDTEDGLSEFPHMILNQARVHDFFLEVMENSPNRLVPDYGRQVVDLTIDATLEYPVTVTIERVEEGNEGTTEIVHARYVVGCDGGRSAVRTAIGRELRGDSANKAWGVMDVLAVTDFPDIRYKTLIKSATNGSIIVIPREGGYLARLYIELDDLAENERVRNRDISEDDLIAAAQRILHPYHLDVKEIPWWSVYEIGQRLCEKFDDVPVEEMPARTPRVFIAGDACHTHSPKAGQGMNVSMRDSFNLGWKLAAVLRGQSPETLLHTYSAERQAVAKELIDFDREWAQVLSATPADAVDDDEASAQFEEFFIRSGRYTAGVGINYAPSAICGSTTHQHLATGFDIGARFHSAPVIQLADAKPVHLGHTVKADGRWRLMLFDRTADSVAGQAHPSEQLLDLCTFLAQGPGALLGRFTPDGADIDSVIDVRAVFPSRHRDLAIETLPELLTPTKGRLGLIDYEKAFCVDAADGRDIYQLRSIDRTAGCVVVVRPDQHVANVLPLDAHQELADFFAGCLREASVHGTH